MKEKRKIILLLLLGAILLSSAGFSAGLAYERTVLTSNDRQVIVPQGAAPYFQKLVDAWNTIQRNYVDRSAIDPARLTDGALSGMVDALGDTGHSRYLQTGIDSNAYSFTNGRLSKDFLAWQMLPGTEIADIYISMFSAGVTNSLQKALGEIKDQQAKGIILDLRDNPGGLVLEAVGVASQFLKDGIVVQEKDADGFINRIPVQEGGLATEIPLAVLINQNTASAAEIVSGALQDAGRARLIGETTFGTGTMLTAFPLPGQSSILLATQVWLTPSGRTLWHKGITPDEAISLPANVPALFPTPAQSMTLAEFSATADSQLQAAVKYLSQVVP